MPKKPGAGKLWTATKKIQDLDIFIRENFAKNFPKAIKILEGFLNDPDASKAEKQQAVKFFTEYGTRLVKECRGMVQEDFADRVTTQPSTRAKQVGRGGSGSKAGKKTSGNGLISLEFKDTGTDD